MRSVTFCNEAHTRSKAFHSSRKSDKVKINALNQAVGLLPFVHDKIKTE